MKKLGRTKSLLRTIEDRVRDQDPDARHKCAGDFFGKLGDPPIFLRCVDGYIACAAEKIDDPQGGDAYGDSDRDEPWVPLHVRSIVERPHREAQWAGRALAAQGEIFGRCELQYETTSGGFLAPNR